MSIVLCLIVIVDFTQKITKFTNAKKKKPKISNVSITNEFNYLHYIISFPERNFFFIKFFDIFGYKCITNVLFFF